MGFLSNVWSTLRGLAKENPIGNGLFMTALIVGFFHGWLKLKLKGSLITFAFDLPLALAMVATLFSLPKGVPAFPSCRMSGALKILLASCLLYSLLPFPIPKLVVLASFRGWCFIPLVFLLGYHLARSVRQIELYIYLLLFLATITAIYGIFFQSREEVSALMAQDPEANYRLQNTFYGTSRGGQFRAFSTFVSAAAFGGTMSYCLTFAVSRLSIPGCPKWERFLLIAISVPMAYAVIASGSRTALVMTVAAFLFIAWYRRGVMVNIVGLGLLAFALWMGVKATQGDAGERFATLLNPVEFFNRLWIVIAPAMESLSQLPLGGGIGRSGHGLPMALGHLVLEYDWRPVDGDLGRMAVDMGLWGLIVFGILTVVGIADSFTWMRDLRHSNLGIVCLPGGTMFMLMVITMPTGSPSLTIPGGALLWFFCGALRRLTDEYQRLKKLEGEAVEDRPEFRSFITQPMMGSIYRSEPRKAATHLRREARVLADLNARNRPLPGRVGHSPSPARKRFLYGDPARRPEES